MPPPLQPPVQPLLCTFHLPNEDSKSLIETLSLFNQDLLDMESEGNHANREHFLFVVKTVLAHKICPFVEGLEWISLVYDKHHQHRHSRTASSRTSLHVDPPLAMDEKKLTDMTSILQTFVDRYLNLLAENLTDVQKTKFLECKKLVEQATCTDAELRTAENFLMETAKEFGLLIIHGDLLRHILNFEKQTTTKQQLYK